MSGADALRHRLRTAGTVTVAELQPTSVDRATLQRFVRTGEVERVARGTYRYVGRRPIQARCCAYCGAVFTPTRDEAVYCQRLHNIQAWKEANRDRYRATQQRYRVLSKRRVLQALIDELLEWPGNMDVRRFAAAVRRRLEATDKRWRAPQVDLRSLTPRLDREVVPPATLPPPLKLQTVSDTASRPRSPRAAPRTTPELRLEPGLPPGWVRCPRCDLPTRQRGDPRPCEVCQRELTRGARRTG